MAKYYNPTTRQIIDVANPEMNPQLIAGATLIPDQSITQAEREVTLPSGKTGLQDPLGNIYQYGTNQVTGLSEKQTITGDLLNPVTGIPFVNPAQTPASPVTLPEKPAPLGTEQQKESDLSKQIQRLQEEIGGVGELVGKEELEIQKRKEFGVEAKIATQQSIFRQLQNLKAFTENIPAILQQESVARGRTAAGIAPLEIGRLRQAGIQANILNAQYSAATGDLATAERQVKNAVHDAFAAKEAELAAKKANLETFKESPEYQGEKKARADAADAKIKADEAKVAAAKKVYEDIVALTTKVTGSEIQDGENALIAGRIAELVNTDEKAQNANVDLFVKAQALAAKYTAKQPTGTGDIPTGVGGFADETIQNYATLLAEGKISLSNVPQNIRNSVVTASGGIIAKPLSDTAIKEIQQSESAVANLNALKQKVSDNLQFVGPISGLARFNPFSAARRVQADIDRVRQQVGKTLEGGVLRKEDEEKYKKILATLSDTPETAIYKIDALITSITRDIETYKGLQQETGRFVPGAGKQSSPEELRTKYNY